MDLGLERAGFELNFHCEVKPFCRKIIMQHWPNLPINDDIRRLDESELP